MQRLRQHGFTLLEILVVLVIGVLIVAITPPLLSGMSATTELRSAARQTAAALRHVRNQAVTGQQEATLTLDLPQRRLMVSGAARHITLPESVQVRLDTVQSEVLNRAQANIRFFPDGSSSGGALTISGNKLAYRVTVDWLTGAVAIVEGEVKP